MKCVNVTDRRFEVGWIGEWDVEPAIWYPKLTETDIGRSVVYMNYEKKAGKGNVWSAKAEAGTLHSFRDKLVFVLFDTGDTPAACNPEDLAFGTPLDGDLGR